MMMLWLPLEAIWPEISMLYCIWGLCKRLWERCCCPSLPLSSHRMSCIACYFPIDTLQLYGNLTQAYSYNIGVEDHKMPFRTFGSNWEALPSMRRLWGWVSGILYPSRSLETELQSLASVNHGANLWMPFWWPVSCQHPAPRPVKLDSQLVVLHYVLCIICNSLI